MIKDKNNITKENIIEILKEYAEQNNNTIDLSGTDLSNYDVNFRGTTTRNVDFYNAKTGNVHFDYAETADVDFENAKTKNVDFYNATTGYVGFKGATTGLVDFREAITDNVCFVNATTVTVDFINATTGNVYTNFGKCTYGGKMYNSILLDEIITVYDKSKEILGFTIYEDVRDFKYTKYALTNDVFSAHSATIKGAIKDLRYKIETFKKDKKPIIDKIKKEGVVSKKDYRIITGACEAGVNDFCNRHNIKTDTLPLEEVLDLFKDKYDYGIKEFMKYMEDIRL